MVGHGGRGDAIAIVPPVAVPVAFAGANAVGEAIWGLGGGVVDVVELAAVVHAGVVAMWAEVGHCVVLWGVKGKSGENEEMEKWVELGNGG